MPFDVQAQASWAKLARLGGFSDPKMKKSTFVRIKNLSFWESLIKICDKVGTPKDIYRIKA